MTPPAPASVLFLQGGGAGVHDNWDARLVASLSHHLGPEHPLIYPRMPNEADPHFARWSAAITRAVERLPSGALAVGHSIGGTILIHTLAKSPRLLDRLGGIFLIAAPFVGTGGWHSDDISTEPGWASPLSRSSVWLYQGDADGITPPGHLDLYAAAVPHARLRRLPGRDHQLNDDLSDVAQDILGLTSQR
jgi:hypothetical protein